MDALYFVVYWAIFSAATIYVTAISIAVISALVVVINTSAWEVDTTDPTLKNKAILRRIEPFEIMVITKGGKPAFPIIDKNEQRLTVVGLQGDGSGIQSEERGQWKVITLSEDEHYPEVIQSRWGYLDPLFIFRKIVYKFTQRHVVRVWFPFFIFGFYELYAPQIMMFVRARAKSTNKDKDGVVLRKSMTILDEIYESTMELVQDKTDHLLYESPIRIVTDTIPTRDGFSIRADVTIILQVDDLFQIVSWKDWSSQIRSAVNNGAAKIFRSGTIDSVYATEEGGENLLQEEIKRQLEAVDVIVKGKSLMQQLGFVCLGITLNDLIPADSDSKKEMERIMAIEREGEKNAGAAGAMLSKQIKELEGKDEATKSSLAAITAAQKSGGRVDWIINQGGPSSSDPATLAYLRRLDKKVNKGEKNES